MTRDEALAKLISIRHHCFQRGVLGKRSFDRTKDEPPEDDFRAAFRTLNTLYVRMRDNLDAQSNATYPHRSKRAKKSGPMLQAALQMVLL